MSMKGTCDSLHISAHISTTPSAMVLTVCVLVEAWLATIVLNKVAASEYLKIVRNAPLL